MNTTETWDLYDIERQSLSKSAIRGEELPQGEYHTVIHVCIFNNKSQMLIQQRQPFKKGWSNLWDFTAAGSAISGETSRAAASRELFEEMGIKHDFTETRPNFTINFERGFADFFIIEKEVEISGLKLQKEEVQSAKWASINEIIKMIDKGEFIPYYHDLVRLIFSLRGKFGSHMR